MILINSSPRNALRIFQPFLPVFVPVGIGSILAITDQQGIKTEFIDEQVEEDVVKLAARYVKGLRPPYIFGFSVLTIALKNAIDASSRLKELYPDSFIVFGGIHPSALPDEVLNYKHVDAVIRGEGEGPVVELYKCVKEKRAINRIDNLSYRADGRVIHNACRPALENIDAHPHFPYHLFAAQKRYNLGFVISSRGCPYECIFCSNRVITQRQYRFRPAGLIVDELQLLYQKYNRKFVFFIDDNFLVNKERVHLLIDQVRKRGLDKKMTFGFEARGDNVDRGILESLYQAGFKSVFFGMETSSEKVMRLIKKNETVADCVNAVRLAKEIGFHVSATFIYGLPGETHQDRMNSIGLSRELELDMVRYNNTTPYPGTELYDIARRQGRLNIKGLYENFNSVSTFIESPFRKIPFSYVPEGATEQEIRLDILLSYFMFYVDMKRIRRILTNPNEGAGWFSAGEKIAEVLKKAPFLIWLGIILFFKFGELFLLSGIRKFRPSRKI